jgi:predicted nucleic acid-binding protein
MAKAYLLDTQIVSYSGNKHPFVNLYQDILASEAVLFIALQSVAEIYFGARNAQWGPKKTALLAKSIAKYRVLTPQYEMAQIWADLMAVSKRQGCALSPQDAWVAATAVSFELPLVSHDKDFIEYPGLQIVRRR